MIESIDLAEVKGCLDSLAMELLRGRFPNVDVRPIILCQFCLKPTKQDGNKLGVVES